MAKQQRGLGRGLDALLGGDAADMTTFRNPVQYVNPSPSAIKEAKGGEIMVIEVSKIEPNPYQPRVNFDPQALEELSASIKTLGLIQPITVRQVADGHYQIISGERRFRASKMAGLQTVPAYVRTTDDNGMLEMAIVENVQRCDLDPIETAMSYQRLIDECHLTQEQMSERIGKSRVAVTNYLRLLKLPARVQYDIKAGHVSVGHAKVLLGLDNPALQESLSDEIIRNGLSVRALEARIREIESGSAAKAARQTSAQEQQESNIPDHFYNVAEILGRYFANNVSVKRGANGKGSMTIRFNSDAQMQAFCDALKKSNL